MKYIVLALVALFATACQPTMTPEDTEGEAVDGKVDGNKTKPTPSAPATTKEGNASE